MDFPDESRIDFIRASLQTVFFCEGFQQNEKYLRSLGIPIIMRNEKFSEVGTEFRLIAGNSGFYRVDFAISLL